MSGKAIIWDFDGTLVLHKGLWNRMEGYFKTIFEKVGEQKSIYHCSEKQRSGRIYYG